MYKNLTWFTASDSPAAHRSQACVIIKTLPAYSIYELHNYAEILKIPNNLLADEIHKCQFKMMK